MCVFQLENIQKNELKMFDEYFNIKNYLNVLNPEGTGGIKILIYNEWGRQMYNNEKVNSDKKYMILGVGDKKNSIT